MTNRNTVPAAQITDAMIEKVILDYLNRPLAGRLGNGGLRSVVADHFTNYSIQTRRVARIAGEMAARGVIKVEHELITSCIFGLSRVLYSAV